MASLDIQVASGADDSFYKQDSGGTPSLSNTANDAPVGLFDVNQTAMGAQMRFLGVTVPQGATINSAYLTIVSSGADSTTTVNSKLRGAAVDNATMATTTGGGLGSFENPPFTTAIVNWDGIATFTNGGTYTTPDISTIIQEIVNRVGWVSGNAIAITWDDMDKRSTQTPTGNLRRAESYDNVPANAPILHIDYTVPVTTVSAVVGKAAPGRSWTRRFRNGAKYPLLVTPKLILPNMAYTFDGMIMLNGSRYKALGSNVYDLLDSTTTEANTRLTELANAGCNTVRVWAFSQDGTAGTAFRTRLDAALSNAAGLGVRLILSLSNYYTDWGGPVDFGDDQTTWFQHVNSTWIAQVQSLVTQYSGNTSILAWELMNEPRPNNDPTSMAWLETVAALIKGYDPSHLICSGSEGFLGGDPYPATGSQSGASPDINLTALNSGSHIDIASMHVYTKYLTGDYRTDTAKTLAAISGAKAAANALGKPLIIGEAGFDPNDYGGNYSRRQFFSDVAHAVYSTDTDGAFIWDWGRLPASSFTLAHGDTESDASLADWMSILTNNPITQSSSIRGMYPGKTWVNRFARSERRIFIPAPNSYIPQLYILSLSAALSFIGAINRLTIFPLVSAVFGFLGSITKRSGKALSGSLSLSGGDRINLVIDPSFEADTVGNLGTLNGFGWNYYGNGDYRGPTAAFSEYGSQSFEASSVADMDGGVWIQVTGLQKGMTVTASGWVKTDATVVNAHLVLDCQQHSAGGNAQNTSHTGANNNSRVSVSLTIDTTAVNIFIGQGSFGSPSHGTVYWDGILLEISGTAGTYFDGATNGGVWSGTANASTSVLAGITKQSGKALAASEQASGSLARRTSKALGAAMTLTGSLLAGTLHKLALTASLAFTGAIARLTGKQLGGSIAATGTEGKQAGKQLQAAATFTGTESKRTTVVYVGNLSFRGTVGKMIAKAFNAVMSFVGSILLGLPQKPIGEVETINVYLEVSNQPIQLTNDPRDVLLTNETLEVELESDIISPEL